MAPPRTLGLDSSPVLHHHHHHPPSLPHKRGSLGSEEEEEEEREEEEEEEKLIHFRSTLHFWVQQTPKTNLTKTDKDPFNGEHLAPIPTHPFHNDRQEKPARSFQADTTFHGTTGTADRRGNLNSAWLPPETNHSESISSGTNHSITNPSGSIQSMTIYSGTIFSGSTHSGSNHSETNHSGSNHSEANHSETNHSGTNHSGTMNNHIKPTPPRKADDISKLTHTPTLKQHRGISTQIASKLSLFESGQGRRPSHTGSQSSTDKSTAGSLGSTRCSSNDHHLHAVVSPTRARDARTPSRADKERVREAARSGVRRFEADHQTATPVPTRNGATLRLTGNAGISTVAEAASDREELTCDRAPQSADSADWLPPGVTPRLANNSGISTVVGAGAGAGSSDREELTCHRVIHPVPHRDDWLSHPWRTFHDATRNALRSVRSSALSCFAVSRAAGYNSAGHSPLPTADHTVWYCDTHRCVSRPHVSVVIKHYAKTVDLQQDPFSVLSKSKHSAVISSNALREGPFSVVSKHPAVISSDALQEGGFSVISKHPVVLSSNAAKVEFRKEVDLQEGPISVISKHPAVISSDALRGGPFSVLSKSKHPAVISSSAAKVEFRKEVDLALEEQWLDRARVACESPPSPSPPPPPPPPPRPKSQPRERFRFESSSHTARIMTSVEVSEGVTTVPLPGYQDTRVASVVSFKATRRHRSTVHFRPALVAVRFSDSLIVFGKHSTRRRHTTTAIFQPRPRARKFAETDFLFAKDVSRSYFSCLDYHIGESRMWFKTCLKLQATMVSKVFTAPTNFPTASRDDVTGDDVRGGDDDAAGPGASQVLIPPYRLGGRWGSG